MSESKGVPNRRNDPWGFGLGYLERTGEHRCIECGVYTTGRHHVVPVSLGGQRQVPLCPSCHNKVHGDNSIRVHLIKRKLVELQTAGVQLGPPIKVTPELFADMQYLRDSGESYSRIAKQVGLSIGTVHSWLNRPDS